MWKMFRSSRMDLLQKTQENLEASQKNNELLALAITQHLGQKPIQETYAERSETDKLKAAYALNLCTVSVSQIIDYNDLCFLEKEYDTILNNLNLEEMPKDEALLNILKQLLDVITFFRIQEGDRALMEEEYAQKVKDAIWSAVPNIGIVATGGNPWAIAISLASQVGIGYMNYRKEKAKISLEKKRSEWELQRSAMEQFNGLRRELFDTAWRLADEYEFPDEYRITERQISQFNNILLDADDMRRYERLLYVKDKFRAYPPFWYYLGSAANSVCQDEGYEESIRREYRQKAIEHFEYFLDKTEHNLLREDQLVASCALEMADLIEDRSKKLELLERAAKSSGNAFDVQQMCAMAYLNLGEIDRACGLLRMLVSENYNQKMNAQLLSRLYVQLYIDAGKNAAEPYRKGYDTMANWVSDPQCLFPMPENPPETDEERSALNAVFLEEQKEYLLKNYAYAVYEYIKQCETEYANICGKPGDISTDIVDFIRSICHCIETAFGEQVSAAFLDKVVEAVQKRSDAFSNMARSSENRQRENPMPFRTIGEDGFLLVGDEISRRIGDIHNMSDASQVESRLYVFKKECGVRGAAALQEEALTVQLNSVEEMLFGTDYRKKVAIRKHASQCLDIFKRKEFAGLISSDKKAEKKIELTLREDRAAYDSYWKRNDIYALSRYSVYEGENSIVAILNDRGFTNTDLIFTTKGIIMRQLKRIVAATQYKDIKLSKSGDKIELKGTGALRHRHYENKYINFDILWDLIVKLVEASNPESRNEDDGSLAYAVEQHILTKKVVASTLSSASATPDVGGEQLGNSTDDPYRMYFEQGLRDFKPS